MALTAEGLEVERRERFRLGLTERLAARKPARPELMDLLRAADGVLAATGATAAPCPASRTAPQVAVA